MWQRRMASALFGLGAVSLIAVGQPTPEKKATDRPAEKKKADPIETAIDSALANDPDVRMARAKIQLAESELAKAQQQVVVKVVTLHASIQEQRQVLASAEERYRLVAEGFAKGGASKKDILPEREKLEAVKAQLARLETELKLVTGTHVAGNANAPADEVHKAAARQGLTCAACHAGPGPHAAYPTALSWWLTRQPPQPLDSKKAIDFFNARMGQSQSIQGPVVDRIRGALDKPVRLGAKGEQVTLDKALEVFKKEAGLDVPVRKIGFITPGGTLGGKPDAQQPRLESQGEELPVGAWLQLYQDFGNGMFYVREYGLLFASKGYNQPPDAVPLIEFWKQKLPPKVESPKK